jgi:hypothetical protein
VSDSITGSSARAAPALKTNTHASIEQSAGGVLVVMIRHRDRLPPLNSVNIQGIGERRAFCQSESRTLELL